MEQKTLAGGSFAPPLTDELLAKYRHMIDSLDNLSQVYDCMNKLHKCCAAWWDLPESDTAGPQTHMTGARVQLLDGPVRAKLFDLIPWMEELDVMGTVLDKIDPSSHRDLRNAAFHLLWHAKELCLDREPITKDKL